MTKDERAKIFEEQAREIWASLESHLKWMYLKSEDGKKWHKKCVVDYSSQLLKLTKLLK